MVEFMKTSEIDAPDSKLRSESNHNNDVMIASGNPILRHKFTADPTAIVFNNTVYLYTGHDEPPAGKEDYVMNEWLCFSSPDLKQWKEHAVPLSPQDFSWAKGDAYASKVLHHQGKFYWYVAVTHRTIPGKAIGVAVADDPAGPFRDARGSALVTNDMIKAPADSKNNLDPTAIIGHDGTPYLFWGNAQCYYAALKENMTELDGPIKTIALSGFTEGACLYRRNEWYYLAYGYEFPEKVAYAMSRSLEGPWEFKGILNELAGNCQTNRPAILDFKGKTYFIYHNGGLKNGGSHRRSVCIDYLYFNPDDTLKRVVMTSEGVEAV
jgi:beta-xylosidase